MWNQILFEAIGEYSYKNPDKLSQVVSLDPSKEWTDEQCKLYNEAACVIVEPNAYIARYDVKEEMDYYYERCEKHGFDFVKGTLDAVDNSDLWKKVIDLIEQIGY